MIYSVVVPKKGYVATNKIGIAYQHLSNLDDAVGIVDSWLRSYWITPPSKEEIKEYMRLRENGKQLRCPNGIIIMMESKNSGWILSYEEEQSSGFKILTATQREFEEYLFKSAKTNFRCPFMP